MGVLILIVLIIIIVIIIASVAKPQSAISEAKYTNDTLKYIQQKHNNSIQRGNQWVVIARQMQVVDPMTIKSLHTPLYDCSSDLFELPCCHDSFPDQTSHNVHRIGVNSTEQVEEFLMNTAENIEGSALIQYPDSLILMNTDTLLEPGASIWRLVKTGKDNWFIYWWRSGMNPSAKKDDPPFWIRDIIADPSKWLKREQMCLMNWNTNPNYHYEMKRCKHQ